MSATAAVVPAAERQGLVQWAGHKFGVDAGKVFPILKATCFKAEPGKEASDAEVAALMIVAREHGLNPFLKEIYAFPDKKGGIVPVVGIDGWLRIINEHPQFNGVEFVYEKDEAAPAWIECHIFRKDRHHPIKVREYLSECKRETGPWKSHPSRMLRHKALIQCARVAFSFANIYDDDEATRIVEAVDHQPPPAANARLSGPKGLAAALDDGIKVDDPAKGAGATGNPTTPGKNPGTLDARDQVEKDMKACSTLELLDLARDMANGFDWTPVDRSYLDEVYKARRTELEAR